MSSGEELEKETQENIDNLGKDSALKALTWNWIEAAAPHRYTHNFSWLGRPIIQFPQDMVAMQELVWRTRPDLIIETGIAHGGSLILSASMLAMLDYQDAVESETMLDPQKPKRWVMGVDVDIRDHNRQAIEAHPMSHRIKMIQGSSIDTKVISQVHAVAADFDRVMVILDSNHTHDHVLAELQAYAPLTSKGSYCLVFDTAIEDVPASFFPDRPWGPGDNPKTAVWEYMKSCEAGNIVAENGEALKFEIDKSIEHKLQITVAPDGYLLRT